MDAYTPDLSGIDVDYYVSTYQRTIFRDSQKLLFDVPVFHNANLKVILLGISPVTLVEGADYLIQGDDIHYDAMSVCKGIDSSFNKTLLKSITMILHPDSPYQVQLKFNQLYADNINYARINKDREIEVTPTLIANMVEQIDYLQQMLLNKTSEYTNQSSEVKLLTEDPSGTNTTHMILGERHDVNTHNNVNHIRPIYGAFFRDSLVVINPLTGLPLADEAYEVIELDLIRTHNTSNSSGVYRTLIIKTSYVGEVAVSYQAYGGSTDVASVRRIDNRMKVVEDHLSMTQFITPNTLAADPTIIAIRNKLQEMEGHMRILLSNATYGDVSTGTSVLKKIIVTDAEPHWWSLATLYRVDGTVENILADVFRFRLKSLLSGMMFECTVSVNVANPAANRISVTCQNSNLPKDALEKLTPKLRILQVTTAGIYSGVVLQLGMRLGIGILAETLAIEDMSGRESCWKLVPFDSQSVPPEDTSVLMPDGTSVFTYGNVNSVATEATIPFVDGLNALISDANIPLMIDTPVNIIDQVVQTIGDIDLSKVTCFRNTITVNIGEADAKTIMLTLPIGQWDPVSKSLTGTLEFELNGNLYSLKCRLEDLGALYRITYLWVNFSSENDYPTMNLINTKLAF